MLNQGTSDLDKVILDYVLGDPTARGQVFGHGSLSGFKHVKAHFMGEQKQAHPTSTSMDVSDKSNDDETSINIGSRKWKWKGKDKCCGSPKTKQGGRRLVPNGGGPEVVPEPKSFRNRASVLEEMLRVSRDIIARAKGSQRVLSQLLKSTCGFGVKDGIPYYLENNRPLGYQDLEQWLCDTVYHCLVLTLPSRITMRPRGYNLHTHPMIYPNGVCIPKEYQLAATARVTCYHEYIGKIAIEDLPIPPPWLLQIANRGPCAFP